MSIPIQLKKLRLKKGDILLVTLGNKDYHPTCREMKRVSDEVTKFGGGLEVQGMVVPYLFKMTVKKLGGKCPLCGSSPKLNVTKVVKELIREKL